MPEPRVRVSAIAIFLVKSRRWILFVLQCYIKSRSFLLLDWIDALAAGQRAAPLVAEPPKFNVVRPVI